MRVHAVASVAALLLAFELCGCAPAAPEEKERSAAVERVSASEAHELMTSDRVVVVDVRTRDEFDASHIVNARSLPLDDIDEESAVDIAPDKNALVLVYCRTGVRSAEAAQRLAELGYSQVRDFGGMVDWPYVAVDATPDEGGAAVTDELPVGVKVVCGKTRSLPEGD